MSCVHEMCSIEVCSDLLPGAQSRPGRFRAGAGEKLYAARYARAEQQSFNRPQDQLGSLAEMDLAEKRREGFHSHLRIGKQARNYFKAAAEEVASYNGEQNARAHRAQARAQHFLQSLRARYECGDDGQPQRNSY